MTSSVQFMTPSLNFHSLVLIPSHYCNSRCDHCYPTCGPEDRTAWDLIKLKAVIKDSCKLTNLEKSLHIAGGEPFLYFPQMLEIMKFAQRNGFKSSITTNGFWGFSETEAKRQVAKLIEAGMCRIEISCDHFHQKYIPLESVRTCLKVLKQDHVYTTLRVITTREHNIDETLRTLSIDDLDGLDVSGSPVVPAGRASTNIDSSEYYLDPQGIYGGHCCDSLNLTVTKEGNVAVCCAGSDVIPSLWLGNAFENSIVSIVKDAEWNVVIKQLVSGGPASFLEVIKEAGFSNRIKLSYTNICHACNDIFSDNDIVQAIKKYAENEQRMYFQRMFSQMLHCESAH